MFVSLPAAAQSKDGFTPLQVKAAKQDPKFFTIDESTIKIETVGPTVGMQRKEEPPTPPPEDSKIDIDQIINIAEKLWAIIEKNKPVVNIKVQYANAVPKGIDHWSQLESWKLPKGTIYQLTAKNSYGMTMINVRFQVLRTYGGKYKGKGQYLTAVTVEPLLVEAGWGYQLNLTAEVPDSSVVNVGTSEDPVAGMMATLTWKISTVVKDSTGKGLYFLQGDGLFQEVGGPFDRGLKDKVSKAVEKVSDKVRLE
ncbi:MAG: hypothetical protein HY927_03040 [Elusimicrobia bacterium]|nr:hypothetical protein [Elusimicrobiota bacterium]